MIMPRKTFQRASDVVGVVAATPFMLGLLSVPESYRTHATAWLDVPSRLSNIAGGYVVGLAVNYLYSRSPEKVAAAALVISSFVNGAPEIEPLNKAVTTAIDSTLRPGYAHTLLGSPERGEAEDFVYGVATTGMTTLVLSRRKKTTEAQ
jgi:transcription initiation factor TFIIIB Brf1 subunit/transcription initiation factor TFIIB